MKKTKCCLAILISLSLMLIGCSNESGISNEPSGPQSLDTLKELSVVYGIEEDRIIINEDFDVAVNKFFSDSSNDGLIAEIVPLGYTFYMTLSKDDDTGILYLAHLSTLSISLASDTSPASPSSQISLIFEKGA